MIIIDNADK